MVLNMAGSYKNKKLQIKQIDEQIKKLKNGIVDLPTKGWIHTLRTTLGMSLAQLGQRVESSPQSILNFEKREVDMTITLGNLKELGSAMGLKLVYGFVSDISLEEILEARATNLATKIVMSTSKQMSLEDQKVREKRLKEAIHERTEELMRTIPKNLWH